MSEKKLNESKKKGKDYSHYPKNTIMKEIMIATRTPNLGDFADKIGIAYSTISNWNNRNKISKPHLVIRAFPELNPEFVMFGNYPVLKQGNATPDQPSTIVNQLMVELGVTSIDRFAKEAGISTSQVRNWLKTDTIPSSWYTYLRKKYPIFFASLEESINTVVEEPSPEYKKEVVNYALLEVIADQNRKIKELEKKIKGTKK